VIDTEKICRRIDIESWRTDGGVEQKEELGVARI
jgi:hypothetical protein